MEKEVTRQLDLCTVSKSCSTCIHAGTCDWNGINKLTVFDIFAGIPQPGLAQTFEFAEVRFKNTRKEFYQTNGNQVYVGMPVLVEAEKGYDLGIVSAVGETARLIFREKDSNGKEIRKIYRAANQKEIDLWQELRSKEEDVKLKARKIARDLGLVMKISDVEYQADGSKVTFYYTAEDRVDFRELIKILAKEFSTRIEMRQIGYRQEAARLGGIGSCGRELCCSTWLTDFRSVSTQAAKYQQLALNPSKLTGQCGKLKCCLNFELDSYKSALTEFPEAGTVLETEKGPAQPVKVDIFKRMIWYTYKEDEFNVVYKLGLDQVNEIIELNKQNQKSAPLEIYADELKLEVTQEQIVKQEDVDSITRFDEKPSRKKNNKQKKNNRHSKNKKRKAGNKTKSNDRNHKQKKIHVKKKNNRN